MTTVQNMKKNLKLTLTAAVALGTLAVASNAFAGRYLVIVKDKTTFAQTRAQLLAPAGGALAFMGGAGSDTKLLKTLPAIRTLVVESATGASLKKLQAAGQIEIVAERFFPAPKPMKISLLPMKSEASSDILAKVMNGERPWGIDAVRAPQAWSGAHSGRGARVLVLDTGIDKNHPAIQPNLEKGKNFFSGDDFSDGVGHGTHVAGTIAATRLGQAFTGVAPEAAILAGRVCDTTRCSNVAVAEGINWGISEKVDVINMSLGGMFGSMGERLAVQAAEEAGVSVVAATGNDSAEYVNYPAAFDTVIAVGAVTPKLEKAEFSNWGPELDIVAPGVEVLSSVPLGSGRESSVVLSLGGTPSRKVPSLAMAGAAEALNGVENDLVDCKLGKPGDCPAEARGKIAVISRGEIPFVDKVKVAEAAGAVGVIIFNNTAGTIAGTLGDYKVGFPVVTIEQSYGQEIVAALTEGRASAAEIRTIAADYAQLAGTSMASPHVAGVVALMKAANKKLTPAQVRDILTRSATPLENNTGNRLGAGLVNAEKAVEMSLSAAP